MWGLQAAPWGAEPREWGGDGSGASPAGGRVGGRGAAAPRAPAPGRDRGGSPRRTGPSRGQGAEPWLACCSPWISLRLLRFFFLNCPSAQTSCPPRRDHGVLVSECKSGWKEGRVPASPLSPGVNSGWERLGRAPQRCGKRRGSAPGSGGEGGGGREGGRLVKCPRLVCSAIFMPLACKSLPQRRSFQHLHCTEQVCSTALPVGRKWGSAHSHCPPWAA